MVLEAARDKVDAVGEERRSERVADITVVGPASEDEADRAMPVDPATRGEAEGLGHLRSISCVTVLRARVNQRRQPWTWNQRSSSRPFGLRRM
jgi:hypothetical protein